VSARVRLAACSIVSLAMALVLSSGPVVRADDIVEFRAPVPGASATDVVYKGEHDLILSIISGQNCSNLSVELSNPLFITQLRGIARERVTEGKKNSFSLEVNPDADIGIYSVTVFNNYTNDGGEQISKVYRFTIRHERSIELVRVQTPHGSDHSFTLSMETFQRFENLTVRFNGDGDIGFENETIALEDPEIGMINVSTTVVRDMGGYSAQEVGYYYAAVIDNRTIELWKYNIPVSVRWEANGSGDLDEPGGQRVVAMIAVLCAVLVLFNILWFLHRRGAP